MLNVMPAASAPEGSRDTQEASPVDWTSAVAQPAFRELLRLKWRVIGPMLALYGASFLGLMLLAGYARPLMAATFDSLDLGYILIAAAYLMCWTLALLYVVAADRAFDPKSFEAVRGFQSGGRR
jgi:uncharacterized membrane protein (DUF485 family)